MLCDATFYGTLAAARALGRDAVPVVVIDSARIAPVMWSRHVTRTLRCPRVTSAEPLVDWLLRFAERETRYVLYPTSDEVAYVLSAHRAELSKGFALYQPDLQTIMRVLDKKSLLEAARDVGFDVPETWFPESSADVARAVRETDGPLMIKPRTQIFLKAHKKGAIVSRDPALARKEYERFSRNHPYGRSVTDRMPELAQPTLQRYYPEATRWIYSLSGFRDATGGHIAMLGAIKVLQRPRSMGIGLCFEHAAVDPVLATRTARLLESIGYYGVFELEFMRAGERLMLIDMNPRFYNQLALDVARGLPLPSLAYAAALGNEAEVARLVAAVPSGDAPYAFCNQLGLRVLLGAQELLGTMSASEADTWRKWVKDRHKILVDPVADADDPDPIWADAIIHLYDCMRHPRAFINMIALDR
jgi:D-aspartate ligase